MVGAVTTICDQTSNRTCRLDQIRNANVPAVTWCETDHRRPSRGKEFDLPSPSHSAIRWNCCDSICKKTDAQSRKRGKTKSFAPLNQPGQSEAWELFTDDCATTAAALLSGRFHQRDIALFVREILRKLAAKLARHAGTGSWSSMTTCSVGGGRGGDEGQARNADQDTHTNLPSVVRLSGTGIWIWPVP